MEKNSSTGSAVAGHQHEASSSEGIYDAIPSLEEDEEERLRRLRALEAGSIGAAITADDNRIYSQPDVPTPYRESIYAEADQPSSPFNIKYVTSVSEQHGQANYVTGVQDGAHQQIHGVNAQGDEVYAQADQPVTTAQPKYVGSVDGHVGHGQPQQQVYETPPDQASPALPVYVAGVDGGAQAQPVYVAGVDGEAQAQPMYVAGVDEPQEQLYDDLEPHQSVSINIAATAGGLGAVQDSSTDPDDVFGFSAEGDDVTFVVAEKSDEPSQNIANHASNAGLAEALSADVITTGPLASELFDKHEEDEDQMMSNSSSTTRSGVVNAWQEADAMPLFPTGVSDMSHSQSEPNKETRQDSYRAPVSAVAACCAMYCNGFSEFWRDCEGPEYNDDGDDCECIHSCCADFCEVSDTRLLGAAQEDHPNVSTFGAGCGAALAALMILLFYGVLAAIVVVVVAAMVAITVAIFCCEVLVD
eukprot:m.132500 g.132500  ORF g.132500 m.132500 type:complete len:472 (+) comp15929_c0_seq3:1238-2653(+)